VIILDTNVLSELMKLEPATEVFDWVGRWSADDLFSTSICQAEILVGIATMPAGRKKDRRAEIAHQIFEQQFAGRVLSFDTGATGPFAEIVASRRRAGRPINEFDAQIASIAAYRQMAVATRDIRGFEGCGIEVVNPWTA
jgi:predicted nucleic acid-binding protein